MNVFSHCHRITAPLLGHADTDHRVGGVGILVIRVTGGEVNPGVLVRFGRSIDNLSNVTQVNWNTINNIDHEGIEFIYIANEPFVTMVGVVNPGPETRPSVS